MAALASFLVSRNRAVTSFMVGHNRVVVASFLVVDIQADPSYLVNHAFQPFQVNPSCLAVDHTFRAGPSCLVNPSYLAADRTFQVSPSCRVDPSFLAATFPSFKDGPYRHASWDS